MTAPACLRQTPATYAALALSVLILLLPEAAYASGTGTSMPWESGLKQISDSFKGPTAYFIAVIGFVVAAVAFVIQGEMTGIAKRLVQSVIGISVLLSIAALINNFFGVSGAVIG